MRSFLRKKGSPPSSQGKGRGAIDLFLKIIIHSGRGSIGRQGFDVRAPKLYPGGPVLPSGPGSRPRLSNVQAPKRDWVMAVGS
jgi:hypothetical protein